MSPDLNPNQAAQVERLAATLRSLPPERRVKGLELLDSFDDTEQAMSTPSNNSGDRLRARLREQAREQWVEADDDTTPTVAQGHPSALDVLRADPELRTVTLAELAGAYGLSTKTLLRDIQAGRLEAVKLGAGYQVTIAQVRTWVRARTVKATER